MINLSTIPGFEAFDRYLITDKGELFRTLVGGGLKQVRGQVNVYGYIQAGISCNKQRKSVLLHRLVALAYIPCDDPTKDTVDHINEDKTDNQASNLRWCSRQDNVAYYNSNKGRRYAAQRYLENKRELVRLAKELKEKEKELEKTRKELDILSAVLDSREDVLSDKIKVLQELRNRNYAGYKDTTGRKFETREAIVVETGKTININGIRYQSIRSATDYIISEEAKKGRERKHDTVRKELRKFLNGRRPAWCMYKEYDIS